MILIFAMNITYQRKSADLKTHQVDCTDAHVPKVEVKSFL